MKALAPIIASLLAASSAAAAPAPDGDTLRVLIREGAQACMAGKPDDVVKHYARDILLAYPGTPDQGYDAILAGYRELCATSGEGTVETTEPFFEEVLVSGDMAVVRVIWNTHLRGMPPGATRQLRDMQIWRRGAHGWEFIRGVHYPLRKPS